MPTFRDSDEMYKVHSALLDNLAAHPDIGPKLAESKLIIRFEVSDPEGVITVNCRDEPSEEGRYVSYILGACDLEPDITFVNSSDFSHEFWQGKINVMAALMSGKTKAKGSIPNALKLLPIIKPAFKLYPEILKEIGREDLIIK